MRKPRTRPYPIRYSIMGYESFEKQSNKRWVKYTTVKGKLTLASILAHVPLFLSKHNYKNLGHRLFSLFFFFFFKFVFLFILVALGVHCYARAFSSCGEQGLLFVEMHRLLTAVASLVAELGL